MRKVSPIVFQSLKGESEEVTGGHSHCRVAGGLPDTHLATATNERREASHHHTLKLVAEKLRK
jgi:hypothetical protein